MMIPNRPIRIRRGSRAAIENRLLQSGEPYLAEDTNEVFVGGENKNIKLGGGGGIVVDHTGIPVTQREAGMFYFVVTEEAPIASSQNMVVSPNMGIKKI